MLHQVCFFKGMTVWALSLNGVTSSAVAVGTPVVLDCIQEKTECDHDAYLINTALAWQAGSKVKAICLAQPTPPDNFWTKDRFWNEK